MKEFDMGGPDTTSFISRLIKKEADARKAMEDSGGNSDSVIREVRRQIKQASKLEGGNPITGEGVTKSGGND